MADPQAGVKIAGVNAEAGASQSTNGALLFWHLNDLITSLSSYQYPSSLFRSCLASGSSKLGLAGAWRWEIISPLRETGLQGQSDYVVSTR